MNHLTEKERIESLENAIKNLATKEEISLIVKETMKEVMFEVGKGTKAVIVTMAIILGSLAVIGGGFKWLLALIGFHKI